MKKMVQGKLLSVQKIATKKIVTWNFFTQFINCLSLPNTSFWQIFTNVKTSEKENSILSNINDNSNNNEKKKRKKRKKTRVGIFENMGGNIPGGNFPGEIHQGVVWLVEIFRVEVFLIPKKIYAKNSQVCMHWHWSSSEKSPFFKPIASVFSPPPIIIFSCGVEILPHPLVQLIGHVRALNGYIEM